VGGCLQEGDRFRPHYQSIGSGGGIKQIQAKDVAFGATDMPLKGAELNKDGSRNSDCHGRRRSGHNVEGVKPGDLTLDGPTFARIFLGQIKT